MKLTSQQYRRLIAKTARISRTNPGLRVVIRNFEPIILQEHEELQIVPTFPGCSYKYLEPYWEDGEYWNGEAI